MDRSKLFKAMRHAIREFSTVRAFLNNEKSTLDSKATILQHIKLTEAELRSAVQELMDGTNSTGMKG